MPQVIVYELSDTEEETDQVKESNVSLDPELLLHVNQPPNIKDKEAQIQEIVNRYVCIENIKSEVSCDIYADPTPSCSYQSVDVLKVSKVPLTPSNSHENVSEDIYDNPTPGCSHYEDAENVSEPIEIDHVVEGNKNNLETVAMTKASANISLSNQPVVKSNDIDSLSNSIPENDIEPSIYKETLQSLSLLYHQINGLHNIKIDVNQEVYFKFCANILKIKSNHSLLISEIEKGNLIKFEQLVVWGRNLKRNVDDLIKEAKPGGCSLDEAKKFVFKMMRTEIRYRQHLADSNETYIFDDTDHFKFHCMACDRRDDNLTWLVAHICRDTAEMIYMCCFCGFLFFNNVCSLIYHVILDSLEGPKKEYCVECKGFFPSVANHLMDIEGSWKVSCNSCDFISLSRCSLSIHKRFHKMEKHHVCPECGAYFVFFEALEDHLRNRCYFYAKKIRHICPICAIIFRDKESLYRHLFSIHHQRWIKCIECHMLLIGRMQYISHRAQNHPESPCTYQICHTCVLCPGREFKSSAAQVHMKNHANDVINVIILYVCDCNYYTIHKYNFIAHKAQNCEVRPAFGKWENDHEMKICSGCNEVKFINLSTPFICEKCEILNSSESGFTSLNKAYECKVCKLFLIYNWEAVIEHFCCSHPNIPVYKLPNCVKGTFISGSNNNWIASSSNPTNSLQNLINEKVQSHNPHTGFLINPPKIILPRRNNNTSNNMINRNIVKTHSILKKQTTKKKYIANNPPFYNNSSHFMASNSTASSKQAKMGLQKKNTAIINIPPLQSKPGTMVVSILKGTAPREGSSMLLADNICARQDSLAVDIKQINNAKLCVSPLAAEKEEPKSSSSNLLYGKKDINEERITPNQSDVKFSNSAVYKLIKTPESSDKADPKGSVIYVKKAIGPNHPDKTNNNLEKESTDISPENSIKTEAETNVTTKKRSLECKKCQYKCNEAVELVKHFVDAHYIQNTYQCMECGECFVNLKNKINHLRSTHKIDTKCYLEPDVNRLDTYRSQFRCPVCLRGFLSEQDKNLHMRCHGMAYLRSIRSNSKEM